MILTRPPRTFLCGDTLKIWTNPRATPNIVVLVHSTLYISSIAKSDLSRAVQLLSTGAAPEQVFGSYHRAVPLISVTRAMADLRRSAFRFTYHTGLGTSVEEFRLASGMEADELVAVLRQQLGDRYTVTPLDFDVMRSWGAPLLALVIHGIASYFAWTMVAAQAGVLHRVTGLERWLQDVPGEKGVLNFAIAVGAVLFLWLISRFFTRPTGVMFRKSSD